MPAHEEDRPEWLITYHFDKIAHLIAYAGLSFLIMRDIGQKWQTLAFCLIYGLIIEIVQGKYFETRHFDILDLFANIIGAIVGIRIFYIIKKKLNE